MPENFREPFVNPYVDEESNEARFSTFVSMDEAHERWNNGTWRSGKIDFELDPSMFADGRGLKTDENGQSADKPKGNRFAFDLQKDIIDADQHATEFDENAYTGNYRPNGSIGSSLYNLTIDRLRYNALADIKEELPEDLSFLYGESDVSRFKKREVTLRSYNRLSTPVDKRRAEVEKMLPEETRESPEAIMADIRKHRDIEDAKSGIDSKAAKRYTRRGIYDVYSPDGSAEDFYTAEDQYDIENITEQGSWRGNIPVQDGLVPDSKEQPYFGRFSRNWSQIEPNDTTRAALLRHTVNTIYEKETQPKKIKHFHLKDGGKDDKGFYVSDEEFDPGNRYRRMEKQRRKISASQNVLSESIMSGSFNNPYVQISDTRLRDIINHDMRGPGHVADPEGLTDPALMYEWNMGYSRINSQENDASSWVEEQSSLAETAEQSRYRGSHRTGRPGAYIQREKPYGSERKYPRGSYNERQKQRRDMEDQFRRATEQGIAAGREILRQQQQARRDAEQEKARRQEEELRRAYEQQRRAYDRQMKAYRKQQEQFRAQQAPHRGKQPVAHRPASANSHAAQQNLPRKPHYGPMGYFTPKPEPPKGAEKAGSGSRRR